MMGGENHGAFLPHPISSLLILLLLICFTAPIASDESNSPSSSSSSSSSSLSSSTTTSSSSSSSAPADNFKPPDNYLLDCGASKVTRLPDGRTFQSDPQSASLLSTEEDIQASVPKLPNTTSSVSRDTLPLYLTARVFADKSTYSFFITTRGHHWIRLYFCPILHPIHNLTTASFSIMTDQIVLLHDFNVPDNSKLVYKEYLLDINSDRISLTFAPKKNSLAFINAIELVSAPDTLIPDTATSVFPAGDINGLSSYALEVTHRLNVGGPEISPKNDTLVRTWFTDTVFMKFPQGAENVSVAPKVVKYPENGAGASPLIAPVWVYATADKMADAVTINANFNLTWEMTVDPTFSYLIRLHFRDIISKTLNDLYFNVYVNQKIGLSSLDLSTLTSGLAVAYYKDLVLNASDIMNETIKVQVGPASIVDSGTPQALLNGLELMKMSNHAGSLDGLFAVDGTYKGPSTSTTKMKIVASVGLALAVTAMLLLGSVFIRWQKRPPDWERRNSFSSWLLPLHASHSSFMSSKSGSRYGSHKSMSGYSGFFSSALGLGRYFPYAELQEATHNWDEKRVIGVGGFGKVYLGNIEDGTKLAIKRGNASSDQGINEFQTEIQMLSKLRHRHLVSLVGYCDENSEMILVYEYMANGPLHDHLYGSNLPHLSWKQGLEICIGAARGLHYLHTGAAQGIIHRDVKTTNILLDENFVAKVSDFGLSKAAPSLEQTHVSTAVKGSFGYLDPEYFRRQQLTEKSDVYSFGVVLFEVLCCRPAICPNLPRDQVNLAEWAMQWHRKVMLDKIVDPLIAQTISSGSLKKFVEAAEKCLAEYGVDRPSMGDVLWNLEYALQLHEASTQADQSDDKSSKHIPLERPGDAKDFNASSTTTSELDSHNSEFSQLVQIQGR